VLDFIGFGICTAFLTSRSNASIQGSEDKKPLFRETACPEEAKHYAFMVPIPKRGIVLNFWNIDLEYASFKHIRGMALFNLVEYSRLK